MLCELRFLLNTFLILNPFGFPRQVSSAFTSRTCLELTCLPQKSSTDPDILQGLQAIAWHFSNSRGVSAGEHKEFGRADIAIVQHKGAAVHIDRLFSGLGSELEVWMSHGDKLSHPPPDFVTIATTKSSPFAGLAHSTKAYYGIQFHPETTHTPQGPEMFKNFAVDICEARQHWTMDEFVGKEIVRIRQLVGEKGQVIGRSLRHIQEHHRANTSQALYLGGSTLRFVSLQRARIPRSDWEIGCS